MIHEQAIMGCTVIEVSDFGLLDRDWTVVLFGSHPVMVLALSQGRRPDGSYQEGHWPVSRFAVPIYIADDHP